MLEDDCFEARWKSQYEEAGTYYLTYHDLKVDPDYRGSNGKKLYSWLNSQRDAKRKGKLSAEQIKMLDAIGMIW